MVQDYQTVPSPAPKVAQEMPGSAFVNLAEAAREAAEASEMYMEARRRWTNAQANLAEANDRVAKSRESVGI